jgi:peptidoglycan L-alanyl-D-glutamate endopeptidase CwlK
MPDFGSKSQERLQQLHPKLQEILSEAIKITDFTIVWAYRDEASQNEAYETGHSNLKWPDSLHNSLPARAVDLAPWPIKWDDVLAFYYLAGVIMAIAGVHRYGLKWGGRWKKPKDYGHFELIEGE